MDIRIFTKPGVVRGGWRAVDGVTNRLMNIIAVLGQTERTGGAEQRAVASAKWVLRGYRIKEWNREGGTLYAPFSCCSQVVIHAELWFFFSDSVSIRPDHFDGVNARRFPQAEVSGAWMLDHKRVAG